MMQIMLLSDTASAPEDALPSLGLLGHHVDITPARPMALIDSPPADAILIDAREDLRNARNLCQILVTTGTTAPVLVIIHEGGTAALNTQWQATDFLVTTAGPAEIETRLRIAIEKHTVALQHPAQGELHAAGIAIDEKSYTARLNGEPLNLTYREFELLKFLLQHPGRVFTRTQLLGELWGKDYYGGTRTIDVHIRRLRAKLGPENEAVIDTVRHVGYRLNAHRPTTTAHGISPENCGSRR